MMKIWAVLPIQLWNVIYARSVSFPFHLLHKTIDYSNHSHFFPQHLGGEVIPVSFYICESAIQRTKTKFLPECRTLNVGLHPSQSTLKSIEQDCLDSRKTWWFVIKALPLLTGKPSLIFGSAVISTSCSLRAGCLTLERMALTRLMVLFCYSVPCTSLPASVFPEITEEFLLVALCAVEM